MTTRVIALDLDGTLLTPKKTLLPSSIEALARAREAGYQLIIVTGRHHVAIHPFYQALALDTPAICCNGTYLYDYHFYRDNDRGLYFSKEEVVAGDVAVNEEMLISDIEKNLKDPRRHQDLRGQMRRKYMCYDNAENNEIIYKQIQKKLSQ